MILVTVGTQLPFTRLTTAVDRWAEVHPDVRVLAQVGDDGHDLRHVEVVRGLSATDFRVAVRDAEVIVAHAGVGVAMAAIDANKPLIVMPRRAELGEHRSEHQRRVSGVFAACGAVVVDDERGLRRALNRREKIAPMHARDVWESTSLVDSLRNFVFNGRI